MDEKLMRKHGTASSRFVYFVQSGEGGPVKVGIATCLKKRISMLQVGNPQPLRFLLAFEVTSSEVTANDIEAMFHRELRPVRIRGEWFDGVVTGNVAARVAAELGQWDGLRVIMPSELAAA